MGAKVSRDFRTLEKVELKHVGQIGAGKTVDFLEHVEKRLVPRPAWAARLDDVMTAEVSGDSLIDEHIVEGDLLICEKVYDISQITQGELVLVRLPEGGNLVKWLYFEKDKIILRSSNRKYRDLVFDRDSGLQIEAIVQEVIRDYKRASRRW